MGNEAVCSVVYGGDTAEAKALLETDEIVVRAPFRVRIPFSEVKNVKDDGEWLRFVWDRRPVALKLGADAAKWAEKIRNPKSRADKIGVKPGQKVLIIGTVDDDFVRELEERGVKLFDKRQKQSDVIFFATSDRTELHELEALKRHLVANGAIWVIRPKGYDGISEADVMAAGKRAGLVDVKVVRFSGTHTAEKFVIPVTKR